MEKATREDWSKRVERWKDSGLSAREFAAETGINARSLSWWRWHLSAKPKTSTASQPRRRRSRAVAVPPVTFVEVSAPATAAALEVVVACGRTVRVPVGFDAPTFERLLAVLERPT
jgi:hypothetical protein